MKNIRIFYLKNCHFLVVKFSVYLNRRVFIMNIPKPVEQVLYMLPLLHHEDIDKDFVLGNQEFCLP